MELTDEQMEQIGAQVDSLIERISEVIHGENHGVVLSAFGRIVGMTATNVVDLVQRSNAVGEQAAMTYYEINAPTEH